MMANGKYSNAYKIRVKEVKSYNSAKLNLFLSQNQKEMIFHLFTLD